MSTEELVRRAREHCDSGVLFPLEPLVPSDPCVRGLYVSAEMHALLTGPEGKNEPWSLARSIMDNFTSGGLISVARGSKYRKFTHMGHLDPQSAGIWTMKPNRPDAGIRIFGQFIQKDMFVALDWRVRIFLESYNSREWKRAMRGCAAEWQKLFYPYQPLTSEDTNAYVSNIGIFS